MSDQFCDKEAAVIRAARSGKWEPTIRTHLDSCAGCREAAKLVATMNSLVLAESVQIPAAPDPQRLWLKAAFAERQKRSARITQLAAIAYGVLAAVIGFVAIDAVKSPFKSVVALQPDSGFSTTATAPFVVLVACILLAFLISSPFTKRSQ